MSRNDFDSGRALLIGIGTGYPVGLKLPSVVRADAEELANVLKDPTLCGYPAKNVELLLDSDATRANILAGLSRLGANAQQNDTVFIFFSGHGGLKSIGPDAGSYICPVDFDWGDLADTGISTDELSAAISNIRAARIMIAIDACHAEGAVSLKSTEMSKGIGLGFAKPALEKLANGAGRVVVASCKEEETSITYNLKGHSLFSYFMLEGLKGAVQDRKDGVIRVLDLFDYISREVPKLAKDIKPGHEQHPVVKVHAESNFPLALRKGGFLKSTTSPIALSTSSLDIRALEKILGQLYSTGPGHDEIWSRAGGDQASLNLTGNGRASWHAAIRQLSQGGGGPNISFASLIEEALFDYPNNADLKSFSREL